MKVAAMSTPVAINIMGARFFCGGEKLSAFVAVTEFGRFGAAADTGTAETLGLLSEGISSAVHDCLRLVIGNELSMSVFSRNNCNIDENSSIEIRFTGSG